MNSEDTKFMRGLKNGDKKIFEEIYRSYYPRLFNYCLSYIGNPEDAQEIIQTIFLRLWIRRDEIKINLSLKAYLYSATKNESLNYLNHNKVKDKYSQFKMEAEKPLQENIQQKLEKEELERLIKRAILKLPDKRRKIFELSRFDGLKYDDIAKKLSVSVKTVETQMSKALKSLRKSLKDYL
jgi:RNA polymerase sigma-70 factor (ECF subfamily)